MSIEKYIIEFAASQARSEAELVNVGKKLDTFISQTKDDHTALSNRVDALEADRDTRKGMKTVMVAVAGGVGAVVSFLGGMLMKWFGH